LKLDTEDFQEDILSARLEISRNIYNSCLAELYKRYNHMRESKQYKKISQLSKGKDRNMAKWKVLRVNLIKRESDLKMIN
jgi:hypothetical protein